MLSDRLKRSQDVVRETLDPHFSWVINEGVPWATMAKPLAESTLALLTSCGIYRLDTQLPFDAWNRLGDPSFREIHTDTPPDRLHVAHTHYKHDHVHADINSALPVEHLKALEAQGSIGHFYPWMISFMGYMPQPRQFMEESAPVIVRRLKQDCVDAALLTPC